MNRSFKDNFHDNEVNVASHNNVSVRGNLINAAGTGITIAICSGIVLIAAGLIFTSIVWSALMHLLVPILVIVLIIVLTLKAIVKGVTSMAEDIARMVAAITYYRGQPRRNKVLKDDGPLVVLDDPDDELQAINAKDVTQNYHYEGSSAPVEEAAQPVPRLTKVFPLKRQQPDEEDELDA